VCNKLTVESTGETINAIFETVAKILGYPSCITALAPVCGGKKCISKLSI